MADKKEYSVKNIEGDVEIGRDTSDGKTAKQAALKLSRKVPTEKSESEAKKNPTEITIRNIDSGAEFVFNAWAWEEERSGGEDWMPDTVTEASVEAKRLDDAREWFLSPHAAEQWENKD